MDVRSGRGRVDVRLSASGTIRSGFKPALRKPSKTGAHGWLRIARHGIDDAIREVALGQECRGIRYDDDDDDEKPYEFIWFSIIMFKKP